MANLISPGVQVTVTDESFFIPAGAPTVPLIFLTTADEKVQPDGVSPAAGTYESNVIRTVTSVQQSTQLYGVPRFLQDSAGNQFHGDARNEYGVLALNQFLGIGSRAYVIRANVNLNDDLEHVRQMWDNKMQTSSLALETLIANYIAEYNNTYGYVPSNPNYKETVTKGELVSLTQQATADLWNLYSYSNSEGDFFDSNYTPAAAISGHQTANFGGKLDVAYQELEFVTGITGASGTGLANDATNYTMDVVLDSTTTIPIVVQGQYVQTYTSLVTEIDNQLTTFGSASIMNGNIRIESATSGASSNVAITDGTTANPLIAAISATVGLVYHNTAKPSGLLNDATVYTCVITVDGANRAIDVVGSAGQTIGDVINEINLDLGTSAVATIANGNILITSATTGNSSTISVTDGTLFASLYDFMYFDTPVRGIEGDSPLDIYGNGYELPPTGTGITGYYGFEGLAEDWVTNSYGSIVVDEFTGQEASNLLLLAADDFKYTLEFKDQTSLGVNDASRRVAVVTALQAAINSNQDIRSENYEYNLVLAPGFYEVVDEMLALVTDIRNEAFVVADTPMHMTPSEAVNWAGTSERQVSVDVAYYYPHALMSNLDGVNVMGAASGVALRTIAYSDSVAELWFAPAGLRRGRITGVSLLGYVSGQRGGPTTFVETNLNQGQRDDMYKYFTNLNPLAFFPGRGFVVWGQKTSAPEASALDRINVSRLIKYIKRQIRKNAMSFVFEPNDQLTRDNLKSAVDSFLSDLITRRGLYDFATLCDESNNTPDRIDRNELWIDVALKPVKAAEFIYVPIRVVTTGAEI